MPWTNRGMLRIRRQISNHSNNCQNSVLLQLPGRIQWLPSNWCTNGCYRCTQQVLPTSENNTLTTWKHLKTIFSINELVDYLKIVLSIWSFSMASCLFTNVKNIQAIEHLKPPHIWEVEKTCAPNYRYSFSLCCCNYCSELLRGERWSKYHEIHPPPPVFKKSQISVKVWYFLVLWGVARVSELLNLV